MENNEQKNFLEEYRELCQKYNMSIVAEPVWVMRDDGSYSTVIRFTTKILS
jgi:hypothetical protein